MSETLGRSCGNCARLERIPAGFVWNYLHPAQRIGWAMHIYDDIKFLRRLEQCEWHEIPEYERARLVGAIYAL